MHGTTPAQIKPQTQKRYLAIDEGQQYIAVRDITTGAAAVLTRADLHRPDD